MEKKRKKKKKEEMVFDRFPKTRRAAKGIILLPLSSTGIRK